AVGAAAQALDARRVVRAAEAPLHPDGHQVEQVIVVGGRAADEQVFAHVAAEHVLAGAADEDVAAAAADEEVVLAGADEQGAELAAVDVLDVGDPPGAEGPVQVQQGQDEAGVGGVVEQVAAAAAVHHAGQGGAVAEDEPVVAAAAGHAADAREV